MDLHVYKTNSPDIQQGGYFASQLQEPQSLDAQECHTFTYIQEDFALGYDFQTNNQNTTVSTLSLEATNLIQDCSQSSENQDPTASDGSVMEITSELAVLEISVGALETPKNTELTAEIRSRSSSGSPNGSTSPLELARDGLKLPEEKLSSHRDLTESQFHSFPDFSLLMEDSTLTKQSPDNTICPNSMLNQRTLPDFEQLGLGSLLSNDKQPVKIGCPCTDEVADTSSDESSPLDLDTEQDPKQLQSTVGECHYKVIRTVGMIGIIQTEIEHTYISYVIKVLKKEKLPLKM